MSVLRWSLVFVTCLLLLLGGTDLGHNLLHGMVAP
jgi:hypothetical protein